MKVGYPCINLSLKCRGNRTFRLRSYSTQRIKETISNNLRCLQKILEFNKDNGFLFFRITSDLIPFASHPVCKFSWQKQYIDTFKQLGSFIKKHDTRISMHPDQFTLINSKDRKIFARSLKELNYHKEVLDLLELDQTAKIQIHVGGVYENKEKSIQRFITRFQSLHESLKNRIVIENDDRRYNLKECLSIYNITEIPILFDSFHHEMNNSGETIKEALKIITKTWKSKDGFPMVDYSSQEIEKRKGTHAETIDLDHFKNFLKITMPFNFDLMLEIKDKEKSAYKALKTIQEIR